METDCAEFQLSLNGYARAASLARDKDFAFVVSGKRFPINRFLADFVSPAVARIHVSDPMCSEFVMDIDGDSNDFSLIMDLARGDPIDITLTNAYFLSRAAQKLENLELIDAVFKETADHELTVDNSVAWLMEKVRFGVDPIIEATFIAEHFWEIPIENLRVIPCSLLEEILASPYLTIETESKLLDTIIRLCEETSIEYRHLLGCIHFEYLDEVGIKAFVNFVSVDDLNEEIWEAISARLTMTVNFVASGMGEYDGEFPKVRIGMVTRSENALFFEDARALWSQIFGDYKQGVVPRNIFVTSLAQMIRYEEQPIKNAEDVIGCILPANATDTLTFSDLCRFLAMFGPANSVMSKISQLFTEAIRENWLTFEAVSDGEKHAKFDVTEMNCLELHTIHGEVRRVWNIPGVDIGDDDFVIDEDGSRYRSWGHYFSQRPF